MSCNVIGLNVVTVVQNPAYFTGSDVRVRDPDLPKLHFAVAFKGASWTDADAIPLMVIQSIIGAWSKGSAGGDFSSTPSLLFTLAAFPNAYQLSPMHCLVL